MVQGRALPQHKHARGANRSISDLIHMSTLYAYWEGDTRHWYYDLCWETVRHHNSGAVLLSRSDVEDVLGELPAAVRDRYVTHRCDWIRKAFISAVGGAWVDMDFICWSDLSWLVEASSVFDYVGWKEWHGTGWMDNFFAARRGSPILQTAADYALGQMASKGDSMSWLAAASEAMNHAFQQHQWCRHLQIPTHLVGPVSVMDSAFFAKDVGTTDVSDYGSLGFMTSMHNLGPWICSLSDADELINGPSILGAILRSAYEQ